MTSMTARRPSGKWTSARANSAKRKGRSKQIRLKPHRSQCFKNLASHPATASNGGHAATSASVMPWMAVAAVGMGTPGVDPAHEALAVAMRPELDHGGLDHAVLVGRHAGRLDVDNETPAAGSVFAADPLLRPGSRNPPTGSVVPT